MFTCENMIIFTCGPVKRHACKKSSRPPSLLKIYRPHSLSSPFFSLPLSSPSISHFSPLSKPSLSLEGATTTAVAVGGAMVGAEEVRDGDGGGASPPPSRIRNWLALRGADPTVVVLGEKGPAVVGGRREAAVGRLGSGKSGGGDAWRPQIRRWGGLVAVDPPPSSRRRQR